MNCDTGAFGSGFRTKATIGRALGLILKNTVGLQPAEQALGVIGSPFKNSLVVGENESKTPWELFHVEQGFDLSTSTITLENLNSFIQSSNYGGNMTQTTILSRLVHNTPSHLGFRPGAVYVISPTNAAEFADISKRETKEYIHKNAVVPTESFSRPGKSDRTPDPDELTDTYSRVHNDSEEIEIVVAGGDGAWNTVLGPMEGGPTTVEIELLDTWESLLSEYRSHLDHDWGKQLYDE